MKLVSELNILSRLILKTELWKIKFYHVYVFLRSTILICKRKSDTIIIYILSIIKLQTSIFLVNRFWSKFSMRIITYLSFVAQNSSSIWKFNIVIMYLLFMNYFEILVFSIPKTCKKTPSMPACQSDHSNVIIHFFEDSISHNPRRVFSQN